MKVVILGPVAPFRGGMVAHTTLLARHLAGRDEVQVLSFRRQYPGWLYPGSSDLDASQPALGLPVHYILDTLNPLSWGEASAWIKGTGPDLLIVQWWVTFMAPAFAAVARSARRAGIPVLFIIHNALPHEPRWFDAHLARLALCQGDVFLCHTTHEEQRLKQLVPNGQTETCPLPAYAGLVDPSFIHIERRVAREKYQLPSDAPILLFFGIVRPYKGLEVLLQSTALLHGEGLQVHVLVAGEFWEDRMDYERKVRQLHLENYVHFVDRYLTGEEVASAFAAADAAVFPYTSGTQSGAAALAQGYGIPLVLTDRSAAGISPELLDPQAVAQPGDPESLARAIRYRLGHPQNTPPRSEVGWQLVRDAVDSLYALVKQKAGREKLL